jgi:hypothetical protein
MVDRRAVINKYREAEISGSKVRSRELFVQTKFIRSGT